MENTKYGKKDGSKTGKSNGGKGRNKTDKCRNPQKTKNK